MSGLADVLASFEAAPVSDLLNGGYVDPQDRVRFQPMPDSLYLVCGERLLRFLAERDDYVVNVGTVGEVTRDFPIDEDDEFSVASLFTLLLGDSYTERWVDRVRAREVTGGVAWCELGFEGGDALRIAPMVPTGLRVTARGPDGDSYADAGRALSWRRGLGWTGPRSHGG